MIYKCKNCASALRYDISLGKLVCDYCGSHFDAGEYEEALYGENPQYETMEQKIYSCSACGAKLMINDVESATFCAYCGQPTVVFDRVSNVRKPDLILPFRITKENAHALIQEKMRKGLFIPKEIKNLEPDVIRGIYIPVSLSDITYEDKQVLRGKVRTGKSTHNKYFYRHANARFKAIPVDQSVKFNDDSAARLEPFPREDFVPFDASFLSGFYADCGDETKENLEAKIVGRAFDVFNKRVAETVRANDVTLMRNDRKYKVEGTKYAMIPVWFFASRYDNQTCTIMVNGYTGKVIGAVPFSKPMVITVATCIGIPLAILFGIIGGVLFRLTINAEDSADEILKFVIMGLVAVFGLAFKKINAFKKSLKLAHESDIFELAKDRQEV